MKFVLISFFLIGFIVKINFINIQPIFGEIYTEKKIANNYLAKKYCDSLEKNLFKGFNKESTLKYEYFFSSIPNNYIKDENKFLEIFKSYISFTIHSRFATSSKSLDMTEENFWLMKSEPV